MHCLKSATVSVAVNTNTSMSRAHFMAQLHRAQVLIFSYLPKSDGNLLRVMSFKLSTVKFVSCTKPAGNLQIKKKKAVIKNHNFPTRGFFMLFDSKKKKSFFIVSL